MAKAYLIGGAPRVGKSNLTMRLLQHTPAYATSTDALTDILRHVIDKSDVPDLFHKNNGESAQESVQWQIKENRIVWSAAVDFIQRNLKNGFDVIVEGLCVMPELVKNLEADYTAVFLGNQSDAHFETIKTFAKNNPADWLNDHSDEVVHEICLFNQAYSGFIQKEAQQHGLPYVEVSDTSYRASIDTAFDILVA